MNTQEFNTKYFKYLEEGFYGLQLDNPEVIEYLDKEFSELIKLPNFKYSQIKGKFNWFCFYCEGVSSEKRAEIENKIKEIYERKEKAEESFSHYREEVRKLMFGEYEN